MENKKIIDYVVASGDTVPLLYIETQNIFAEIMNLKSEEKIQKDRIINYKNWFNIINYGIEILDTYLEIKEGTINPSLNEVESAKVNYFDEMFKLSFIIPDEMKQNKTYVMESYYLDHFHNLKSYLQSKKNQVQDNLKHEEKELLNIILKIETLQNIVHKAKIIELNNHTLQTNVMEYIQKGYMPIGGVNVKDGTSFQAMIKYED